MPYPTRAFKPSSLNPSQFRGGMSSMGPTTISKGGMSGMGGMSSNPGGMSAPKTTMSKGTIKAWRP